MHTALIGTDFNQVTLDLLEKVYFDHNKIEVFLTQRPESLGIQDMVIIPTCNRMEIYYTCEDYDYSKQKLISYLSEFFSVSEPLLSSVLYHKRCLETVKHLYELSSGVKSMVYGENEILSQIKSFYSYCQKQGGFQSHMNKLFQSAIHVGKQVREETLISKGSYSISSIAVDAMLAVFDDFCTDRKVLIVGAGIMSRRAIKKLKAIGHQEIYVTNRSQPTLDALSDEFGLAQIDYSEFKAQLSNFDCVYFATSAKDHVLSYDDLSGQQSPLLLVDVGVPRNVDPKLNNHALVSLITIDDLKKTADKTFLQRKKDSSRVFEIINSSATEFTRWYEHRKAISEDEICLNASA